MTSLNINTRLLIALGIVIDFLDLERQAATLQETHTLELPRPTLAKCLYSPRRAAIPPLSLRLSLSFLIWTAQTIQPVAGPQEIFTCLAKTLHLKMSLEKV